MSRRSRKKGSRLSFKKYKKSVERPWKKVEENITNKKAKKKAAKKSAEAQTAAQEQNRAFAREFVPQAQAQTQALYQPYTSAGASAQEKINQALGLGGQPFDFSTLTNSPEYQFALEQGQRANANQFAGTGLTGTQAKELSRFNQGLATKTFDQYLQDLSGVANLGAQSANAQAGDLSQWLQTSYLAETGATQNIADIFSARQRANVEANVQATADWTNIIGQGIAAYSTGGLSLAGAGGGAGPANQSLAQAQASEPTLPKF